MKIITTVVLVLVLTLLLFTPTVGAQDLGTLLNQAIQSSNQMLSSIQTGLQTTDLAIARAQARAAVAEGQSAQTALEQALALAPDDATRSTISANITHIKAAIDAANQAATGPDSDVKGKLDAARGEAEEALNELKPLAPQVPPTLPRAGGVSAVSLVLAGALIFLAGLGLRRVRIANA